MADKKYDVYGIGNALVDLEFEINDQFISKYDIEKGFMTLVDEERQNVLVQSINHDEVKMECGGSAANTIIAINQFGGNCFYSCKVANDHFGKFYLNDLNSAGVDTNLKEDELPDGITGKCLVMITPDAERTMNTFLGITENLSKKEVDKEAISQSKYVYIEGYLVANKNGQKAMKKTKKWAERYDVKTSITFSDPSMTKFFRDGLIKVIGDGVDLLFCNEEEAMIFTESSNIVTARESLKKYAGTFVITQGKNGAMIFDGTTFIDIEPYPVKAIDTNGAGDMFAGAFLYSITHGHSYAEAGKIASMASSKVVSKFGPRLEWHQTREILDHILE